MDTRRAQPHKGPIGDGGAFFCNDLDPSLWLDGQMCPEKQKAERETRQIGAHGSPIDKRIRPGLRKRDEPEGVKIAGHHRHNPKSCSNITLIEKNQDTEHRSILTGVGVGRAGAENRTPDRLLVTQGIATLAAVERDV